MGHLPLSVDCESVDQSHCYDERSPIVSPNSTGILAPILAGTLLTISPSLPLFTSAVVFALAAGCAVFLPFEKGGGGKAGGGGGFAH